MAVSESTYLSISTANRKGLGSSLGGSKLHVDDLSKCSVAFLCNKGCHNMRIISTVTYKKVEISQDPGSIHVHLAHQLYLPQFSPSINRLVHISDIDVQMS